ncbi:hypothetical protein ABZ800_27980 [Streptomyces sp. NPDC047813]|uniref:hypothetical protein n=1 Tax=Streptomyces sp. NPDC047813 TaxID=3154608 RepID=UPI0033F2F2E0
MSLSQEFEKLDRVPWKRYGCGEIPEVFRALVSTDTDRSDGAIEELYGLLLDQETVSLATVQAVPFVARLVVAGHRTSALLYFLGRVAAADDDVDIPPGSARESVAEQLPLLLPLLGHRDAEVRQLAVWAVAQCRSPEASWTAMKNRWVVELDPRVKGDLLLGCVLVDRVATQSLVTEALSPDQPDQVQISALVASLDTGLAWNPQSTATAVSLLPASKRIGQTPWLHDPFPEIVQRLLKRGELNNAVDLVVAALSIERLDRADARKEGLWGADKVGERHPEVRVHLLSAMLPLVEDPGTAVVRLVNTWRKEDRSIEQVLMELASKEGDVIADRALALLINLDVAQASALLARNLPQRPRALAATVASEAGGRIRYVRPIACTPELLKAIRTRLVAEDVSETEAGYLLGILERWGPAAHSAIPELMATLSRFPRRGPGVLASVATGTEEDRAAVVDALRAAVDRGDGGPAAVQALLELTRRD